MKYLIIAFVMLCYSLSGAQDMIKNINDPVTTDFGVYYPVSADFTPQAVPYTVNSDFSNVSNYSDFRYSFNKREKFLLTKNCFTVTYSGYKKLYDIYNDCTWSGTPLFITTDCVLHIYHVLYDKMLAEIEENHFYSDLDTLTTILLEHADSMYDQYTSQGLVKDALLSNLAFLTVAKELLNESEVDVPDTVITLVTLETDLIEDHIGYDFSPVLGIFSKLDYSHFKPRGHYTRNDTLINYFKTMIWYGWTIFTMEADLFGDLACRHTLQALLLTQMIHNLESKNQSLYQLWQTMYEVTSFFAGRTDDPNLEDYAAIAEQVYTTNFYNLSADSLVNSDLLHTFMQEVQKLPEPKIPNWIYGTFTTYKGWRFMGQRLIPDSYIFNKLVLPEVGDVSLPRYMPMGLDVMSVFGSQRAYSLLDTLYNQTRYTNYTENMNLLCNEFSQKSDQEWVQNLYWNWLYCLMPLLYDKDYGYPSFMQNNAWGDKELYTTLASWTEFRHDAILYAKQSQSPLGIMPGPPRSYVEPNPYLYARLSALVQYTKSSIEAFDLLSLEYEEKFELFKDLLSFLKKIAIKELENSTITSEEYENLFCFGKVMEEITTFNHDSDTDDLPIIADVHTDSNYDLCLEEAVGYPLEIFVIVNQEGKLHITRGAIFSYYEFNQEIANRLDDEDWLELLTSDPPSMPEWSESFRDKNKKLLELWEYSPKNIYNKEFSAVDEIPSPQTIPNFSLLQNFPNPFNPQTTITFTIFSTAQISIEIYNTLGRKIKQVYKGRTGPGSHSMIWDATDESGRKMASGVYLVILSSNTFREVKKICLMR